MNEPELMLIGEPNAGKTALCVQLVKRMQRRRGQLELISAPEDLGLIAEPLKAMNEGRAPEHTETGIYGRLSLRVRNKTSGRDMILSWPDYGGEQILEITRDRIVPPVWIERISKSNGWAFIVRLNQYIDRDSLLTRPIGDLLRSAMTLGPSLESKPRGKAALDPSSPAAATEEGIARPWPAQVRLVELFQALLYVRQVELGEAVPPPLLIVLSCWDELAAATLEIPEDTFRSRMPLFYDFVKDAWQDSTLTFYGLSAQGRALRKEEPDADYARVGPENFGYLIRPDGKQSPDLSELVSDLLAVLA